ncbi:MAG TPA: DVUA0089 family protein [Candidatus Eisenbacteria bacterium]|nr:DVUA0089 family protein [Candidatus Eisenbacteria bacterium]
MSRLRYLTATLSVVCLFPFAASADTTSYTGTLSDSADSFTLAFSLPGPGTEAVSVQTFGFGGGTNGAGTSIPAGGFDPLVALFSGTGSGATLLTDASGNPYGTSDILSNYGSFTGCPPAGTQDIGGTVCGDITMTLDLAAGNYTLLLSDAAYLPNAIFDNGTLDEGFTDLTGGAFQTCNTDATGAFSCVDDTSNWAFDLTTESNQVPVPEPSTLNLLCAGLIAYLLLAKRG